MGAVIKFVLILIVVLYLVNKVGRYFYELFFPNREKQQNTNYQQQNSSQDEYRTGGTHANHSQKPKSFQGGDYVDFEEIE